jgi:hypothetical protein
MQPSTLEGRHPSIQGMAQFFEFGHLPEPLRNISADVHDLAEHMIIDIQDSPMLTTALHKLWEAKNELVAAKLAEINAAAGRRLGQPIPSAAAPGLTDTPASSGFGGPMSAGSSV